MMPNGGCRADAVGSQFAQQRGPAGLRFQQVNSGFDGMIRAIGSIPSEDGGQPSLIAAIIRYKNFLKMSGETQLIMTLPQE